MNASANVMGVKIGNRKSFVDSYLTGESLLSDIDDFIESWHASGEEEPLASFLGFSDDEYAIWVELPRALGFILQSKKLNISLRSVLDEPDPAVAARAGSLQDATALREWLVKTKRIS